MTIKIKKSDGSWETISGGTASSFSALTGQPTDNANLAAALNAKQNKASTATGTLTTAGWSSSAQTIAVTGVTATNIVIVTPAPASHTEWTNKGVYCSAQGDGTLTFICGTTPTSDLTVNVVIL